MAMGKMYLKYRQYKSTEELSLDHQGFVSFLNVPKLKKYKNLKILRLRGNAISDFSGCPNLSTLQVLDLQQNQIVNLQQLPPLGELIYLDLSGNRVESIPQLNLPKLTNMNLENNNLTVESMYHLPRSVKELNLRDNRLTDLDSLLTILSKLSDLQSLDLSLNPLMETCPDYKTKVLTSLPQLRRLNGCNVVPESQHHLPSKRVYKLQYERVTQHPNPNHLHLLSPSVPSRVDLTTLSPEFSPTNWPVWDQGNLGSCTAFAILSSIHYYAPEIKPSTLFQYYNERFEDGDINGDNGSTISQAAHCLSKYGYCSIETWPYDITQFTVKPSPQSYEQGLQNIKALAKIFEFESINYCQQTIIQCLSRNSPIVLGISVYESFESPTVAKTGQVPMPMPNEQLLGGHAVSLVGYDLTTRKWKLRNSWGANWGDDGYFYLPFEYISEGRLASDLWTIKKGFNVDKSPAPETIRPSAPSLSVSQSFEPGSPVTRSPPTVNPCLTTSKISDNKPVLSLLAVDQSSLKTVIDKALESLPSTETIITTVIGILTLVQQILAEILSLYSQSGTSLTLDQKGQLLVQCTGPIVNALLQKKMITLDLAKAASSSIHKLGIAKPKPKKGYTWWRSKNQRQVEIVDPHFGMTIS